MRQPEIREAEMSGKLSEREIIIRMQELEDHLDWALSQIRTQRLSIEGHIRFDAALSCLVRRI